MKNPVTVPSSVKVPPGCSKLWLGIVQVVVFAIGAAFAAVLVSVNVWPVVVVKVKVRSNAVE